MTDQARDRLAADTPVARLRAALDALHPSARYVRVEAIDLAAAIPAAADGAMSVEEAALALAESRPKNKHGQLCPVWTRRHNEVRHAATIADCDCWILREARADAALAASSTPQGLDNLSRGDDGLLHCRGCDGHDQP